MQPTPCSGVLFVEPVKFFSNTETAKDNKFQPQGEEAGDDQKTLLDCAAKKEYHGLQDLFGIGGPRAAVDGAQDLPPLAACPTTYWKWADEPQATQESLNAVNMPDAIFPNNSISLHQFVVRIAETELGDETKENSAEGGGGADLEVQTWCILHPMSPGRRNEIPPKLHSVLQGLVAKGRTTTKNNGESGDAIQYKYHSFHLVDMRPQFEPKEMYLEGTGAMNFEYRKGEGRGISLFVSISKRAHMEPLKWLLDNTPLGGGRNVLWGSVSHVHVFRSVDHGGKDEVYHTNVVGWNGEGVSGYCLEAMRFDVEKPVGVEAGQQEMSPVTWHSSREDFLAYFAGRLIQLTFDEMHNFAGNALEVVAPSATSSGETGPTTHLVLSQTAWDSLRPEVKTRLLNHYEQKKSSTKSEQEDNATTCSLRFIHPVVANTIEREGGGSVRCLLAAFKLIHASAELMEVLFK